MKTVFLFAGRRRNLHPDRAKLYGHTRHVLITDTLGSYILSYWVTQKLPQIYTANPATFPIQMRNITVQICGNFCVTK